MNAYCPDCETELDQSTGICPACRWDPLLSTAQAAQPTAPQISLTERYRGTEYDLRSEYMVAPIATVSRGRTFVLVGLAAVVALSILAVSILGVL